VNLEITLINITISFYSGTISGKLISHLPNLFQLNLGREKNRSINFEHFGGGIDCSM
jgi:hypothetical protein